MAYKRSIFPEGGYDVFKEKYDVSPDKEILVDEYYALWKMKDRTTLEEDRFNQLAIELEPYLYTAEHINHYQDAMSNVQKFFVENTQGHIDGLKVETRNYVDGKQQEMNTYIAGKKQEVQTFTDNTVDFVEGKQQEMQAELDKFTYLGIYNNSTTYSKWNVVTYSGETYLSLVNTNLNHTPGTSPTYWSKIAAQGEQGIPGIGLSFVGNYNPATTYNPQEAVNFNNAIYHCIQLGTDKTPNTSPAYWQLFMESTKITVSSIKPTGGWWFEEIAQ